MSRQTLNLTAAAWRQLRQNWQLPSTFPLLWQTHVAGQVFSGLNRMQDALVEKKRARAPLSEAVVILGYWRSGTTLLHELLCRDQRYTYPTTYACMNPHHFCLTQASALANADAIARRPMDAMPVTSGSPQETEFALLSLGARSPYEALLAPRNLADALKLADPDDLFEAERRHWEDCFRTFLQGVVLCGGNRPLILKSPADGARVAALRRLLPDARFILIVRNPYAVFESAAAMWREMTQVYRFGPPLDDDAIRQAVLKDRLRFETKLAAGLNGLAANRLASLRFEDLVADPLSAIAKVYERLDLQDFAATADTIAAEVAARSGHTARDRIPNAAWRSRIAAAWSNIFTQYGYHP